VEILTWDLIFDLDSPEAKGPISLRWGKGWALTRDDKRIIMSDGTPELRYLDPATLSETGRIRVTLNGNPVQNVNELEWVKGRSLQTSGKRIGSFESTRKAAPWSV